jgi:peptide/nickel transport system substrate-binding protein
MILLLVACGTTATPAATTGTPAPAADPSTAAPVPTPTELITQVNTGNEKIADPNGTIVYGVTGSPNSTYSQYKAGSTYLMLTIDAIFDKLVYVDSRAEVHPRAAKSWEWSEDGKTITFNLNQAYWHDGVPVTSEDWAWTFHTLADPDRTNAFRLGTYLEGTDPSSGRETERGSAGIEIVDELTFKIHLRAAVNKFSFEVTTLPTVVVLPKHLFTKADGTLVPAPEVIEVPEGSAEESVNYWKRPIGSGPVKIIEDSLDQYTKTEAFDKYYGYGAAGPQFKYIVFQYISDAKQIGSKIVAGDIDLAYPGISADDVTFYTGDERINMVQGATTTLQRDINFDSSRVPKYIRLAVNYAMDKQFIVDNIYGGRGIPGGGSLVMPSYAYFLNIGTNQDLELAKSYYEKAIENGSWTADQVLHINVTEETSESVATIIKAYCDQIGLKIEVARRDSVTTVQQNMFVNSTEGYDAVLWSFAPTVDPSKVGTMLTKGTTVDGNFFMRWGTREEDAADNAAYTDAYTKWTTASTPAEEQEYSEAFQRAENEGCPAISICNLYAVYAYGNNVGAVSDSGLIDVTPANYYNQDVWNWISYQR